MRDDQALGLRRLFGRRRARMLGVIGEEATAVTLELAAAFVRARQRVLLLDRSCGEAARALGLRARYELRHALCGDRALRDIVLDGPAGVTLLPATRGLDDAGAEGAAACERLVGALDDELGPFDLLLINGAPLPLAEAGVLLALAPTSSALTHAYAGLKQLARQAQPKRCDVAIHRARSEAAALDAFDSVALTAGRFLGMTLALAGTMPGAPQRFDDPADTPRGCAIARIAQRLCADPPASRKAVNH
jgi:flagellar biosynthesis protein FlhG